MRSTGVIPLELVKVLAVIGLRMDLSFYQAVIGLCMDLTVYQAAIGLCMDLTVYQAVIGLRMELNCLPGGDRVLHGAHGLSGGVRADGSGASEQPGGGRAAGMGGLCGGDKAPGEGAFDLFGEVPRSSKSL